MIGYKRDVNEGGTRNFLAVRGPGVPAGAVDSTLLHITDVLPTLAALAGISPTATPHLPWDGVSFANLLSSNAGSGARGDAAASATQAGRTVFTLGPRCWDADAVPDLGADRCESSAASVFARACVYGGGLIAHGHCRGKCWAQSHTSQFQAVPCYTMLTLMMHVCC